MKAKKWFYLHWYRYLFQKPLSFKKIWCRVRRHPDGMVYYSKGFEPDYHCKNCGDEL